MVNNIFSLNKNLRFASALVLASMMSDWEAEAVLPEMDLIMPSHSRRKPECVVKEQLKTSSAKKSNSISHSVQAENEETPKDLYHFFFEYKELEDYCMANDCLTKAANQGYAKAQYKLGEISFDLGRYKKALEWFQKAAKNDNADALYTIGVMHLKGIGLKKDPEQALQWFEKALKQEGKQVKKAIGIAQYCIGYELCKKDQIHSSIRALDWFAKAKSNECSEAQMAMAVTQFKLGVKHAKGVAGVKDFQQALSWFTQAQKSGHSKAAQAIADTQYEKGMHLIRGKLDQEGQEWVQKAAAGGNMDAKAYLERQSVPKNGQYNGSKLPAGFGTIRKIPLGTKISESIAIQPQDKRGKRATITISNPHTILGN